ncbi:glycoside hydrolase family 43 protein [Cylindrobasidium torrendii FP15055 ss-10]|uniref:Glycoside hydrolase family 43 protein n=1 Tax=Cylindrobasidium torrendii FP15055 ss-10 TaxID=1314674 RepID=A0A0D7BJ01_9AGAR|nr:glycoside hydrolase family 43 protein [Cylindrobasidium torrendii FP15055 ss-10]
MKFSFPLLVAASVVLADTFTNPVLWNDLADLDVFRVEDTYYYSASTMHYSPGAPVLRSHDLVNWEYIGHSVPSLDFGRDDAYNLLNGEHAYVNGIWASFLNYRLSTGTFIWGGCIDFSKTYIYTAADAAGPYTQASVIDKCYYDAGLLVDEDTDTLYVAYGSTNIQVAQLSEDGLSEVSSQTVYNGSEPPEYIEGSRMYKINGTYYIAVTRPANAERILKSTSGPFGPYEERSLVDSLVSPVGGGGSPHQGGLVSTPEGKWYYMGFSDAYPGGRIPVLAPITFDADGWPALDTTEWQTSYDYPTGTALGNSDTVGVDAFDGPDLGPKWEWNHNPDTSKFTVDAGLTLQAATITDDLFAARNTLTHRILGPKSSGTIELRYGSMADGDIAGLSLFRDKAAYVGVKRTGQTFQVVYVDGLEQDSDNSWATINKGTQQAAADLSGDSVQLRLTADIAPNGTHLGQFAYSTNGEDFTQIGESTMTTEWEYFMGYRFGIFNFATVALGGSVLVPSFDLELA